MPGGLSRTLFQHSCDKIPLFSLRRALPALLCADMKNAPGKDSLPADNDLLMIQILFADLCVKFIRKT